MHEQGILPRKACLLRTFRLPIAINFLTVDAYD